MPILGYEGNYAGFSNDQYDDSFGGDSNDGPAFGFQDSESDNFFAHDDLYIEELQDVRKVQTVEVKHSTVSKRVDVKRLKSNLWTNIDAKLSCILPDEDSYLLSENNTIVNNPVVSFRDTVKYLSSTEVQGDVSFAFYFICILHLANENELQLENADCGLSDFVISRS